MTAPRRIRLSRQRGYRKPEGAIVVARPSRWGNPFRIQRVDCHGLGGMCWTVTDGHGLEKVHIDSEVTAHRIAVSMYELHIGPMGNYELDVDEVVRNLGGHDLACWCPLDRACHASVLLKIANGGAS